MERKEYKYEFDKFKNWIKKESVENNKINYIKTRKIEYNIKQPLLIA
jgi:hypothetical protein